MKQDQFLHVIDREEAERRFHAVLDLRPLRAEEVGVDEALHRVLARDVVSPLDVPSFDRSNVDGFAVRAEDTFGATEDQPRRLRLTAEVLPTGVIPEQHVLAGWATALATGAMLPRGADAVVMVEHTDVAGGELVVRRPVTPGANLTFAGTDIGRGETVLRRAELLTSRETGVLAALGVNAVPVVRRPRVAIVSTGNEIIAPGQVMRPGLVYDSNATILADAVRECGGEPVPYGIVPDDRDLLTAALRRALGCDVVLLSGGTSKGEGDLSYRVVAELGPPGIVAHGVALKPGKPLCLAAVKVGGRLPAEQRTVPVVILPGFPTSATFTFHEFVAPVIRRLAGRRDGPTESIRARLPLRVNSERGRTEYLLVGLVEGTLPPAAPPVRGHEALKHVAYPMGKGSGSVTAFSRADGFVIIPRQQEYLEAGAVVEVRLLGRGLRPADLVVIGSHCTGLDFLLGRLQEAGFQSKSLAVGSMGGLEAARRGECDVAGIHLLEPNTSQYNSPFVSAGLVLVPGYQRLQGIVFRQGDPRFEGHQPDEAVARALADPHCVMVNRNRGSGTRLLIDRLLGAARPAGYSAEPRSHNAVAAAVFQGRADWGVAIATVARDAGLGFLPLQEECYDFVVPETRLGRPAVRAFRDLFENPAIRKSLEAMGFRTS
jgi:putative molybdopterin biosynthesis protein